MSKKRTMGNRIQRPPSEDEESVQKQPVSVNQEELMDFPGYEEHAEEDRNKQLLDILGQLVVNTKEDKYRLTWQAFYSLKQQQMALNRQMLDEIDKVKDKYEVLKQPIYTDISNAVLGQKINKGQANSYNLSKISRSIPDFWIIVFTKSGILSSDMVSDIDCFRKLNTFTCEMVEDSLNNFKIRFTFKQQPLYFSNKELQICIKIGDEDEPTTMTIKRPLNYKTPRIESSFFTQLFDNENLEQLATLATEINQNYRNSLYFYFSKYHSSCNTSQVDEESQFNLSSGKKVKSEPSSAEKVETSERINLA